MLEQTFMSHVESSIKKNWKLPAFTDYGTDNTLTYKETAHRIARLHFVFEKLGVQRGDKIAILGRNCANWGVSYMAILSYGAAAVPILPDFKPSDAQHIINHSDSVLLFADDSLFEAMEESELQHIKGVFSLKTLDVISTDTDDVKKVFQESEKAYLDWFDGELTPEKVAFKDVKNDELAVILYTSGTTGFSKGVMLSHNTLISNVLFIQQNIPTKAGDHILSFLPIAHVYGCSVDFLAPFCTGAHVHFLGKMPSPKILLKAFSEVKPVLVVSVPLILEKIYYKQIKPKISQGAAKVMFGLPVLSNVVAKKIFKALHESFGGNFYEVVIGGAGLNPEVENFLRKIKFPLTNGYGMTECAPLISFTDYKTTRMRSVGQAVDRMEVKIDSADPENEPGEILTRGENLMWGYYKNEAATKEVIDEDGWLHTGDMGVMDKDGFVYIRGRCKSMLLGASGKNIYPEEIEVKLNAMKYVAESVVLQHKDQVVALVHPDLDVADTDGLTEDQLAEAMEANRRELNGMNPGYMHVSKIKLYPEEFEKTPKRTIKRFLYAWQED